MFEGCLGQRSNRLDQVMKTAIRRKVTHNGDATLRAIPEGIEYANVLLRGAEALPVGDPAFEDFADLSVADWHFLDAVDL